MEYTVDEVYGLSRNIPLNYVERHDVDERLRCNLNRDKHITIFGSSKQGKTCLRKHCLNKNDYILVQCSNRWSLSDLNANILKRAGYELTESTNVTYEGKAKVSASVKMHKWLLYPILTSSVEELSKGLTYRSIRLKITSVHPQGKNLNPGNITQALKAVSSLQLSKSIQPIILDYDESNLTLHIVDKGFLIWLSMQDRNELLSTVGLPEMT